MSYSKQAPHVFIITFISELIVEKIILTEETHTHFYNDFDKDSVFSVDQLHHGWYPIHFKGQYGHLYRSIVSSLNPWNGQCGGAIFSSVTSQFMFLNLNPPVARGLYVWSLYGVPNLVSWCSCFVVVPVTDCRPVQGVPRFSPCVSCDRFQSPVSLPV